MGRNCFSFALAIDGEQPHFILLLFPVVNDADATALAFARNGPAQLSDTATPANDFACFGALEKEALQANVLVITQVLANEFRERGGFDEYHATPNIRQRRTRCQGLISLHLFIIIFDWRHDPSSLPSR